jgi:hypothetical protein
LLGLLDEEEKHWSGLNYQDFMRRLMSESAEEDITIALRTNLNIDEDSDIFKRLEWLGLLSEDALPLTKRSALDLLADRMQAKLQYEEGERDMIILQHRSW